MNRRQFLSSVAGLGVSAALPTIALPIERSSIQFMASELRLLEQLSQQLMNAILYGDSHSDIYQFTGLAAPPLDSPAPAWQDDDAGDVPVVE